MLLLQKDYAYVWLSFLCAFLHAAVSDGEWDDSGVIAYMFEAEEGIILQEKIIHSIKLTKGNVSDYFLSDEPQFRGTSNIKIKPQPQYFDVIFRNATPADQFVNGSSRERRSEESSGISPEYANSPGSTLPSVGNFTSTAFGAVTDAPTTDNVVTLTTKFNKSSTKWYYPTTRKSAVTSSSEQTAIHFTLPNQADLFEVMADIKQIYDLDREKSDVHFLTINCYDANDAMIDLPTLIVIKVTDKNDNSPIFVKESLSSQITKDTMMGEVVGHIKATDADIGGNADLRFSIMMVSERINNATESPMWGTFIIEEKHGLVYLVKALDDFEVPSIVTFKVIVQDRGGRSPANRATATATVSITDHITDPPDPTPSAKDPMSSGAATPVFIKGTSTDTTPPASASPIPAAVIAGCTVGGAVFIAIIVFIIFRIRRSKRQQNDGQLEFMLNDETLIVG